MPSKNTEKNLDSFKELQKNISPILVINNPSLKPYIELFEYVPENIYQKPLGSLIGFFEIKEYSDDSAYVVNFLTSVLKKEYYANPKRPVTESFDSALHKVNLALSEVAKHGNVEWIGKLHASICVVEKNNIHFTVAGNAKIFLNRKTTLTDISEGLSSDENEPHPLKTFVNVSSGRIEKEDRLIITSEDIFHILKLSDLKKNLQRLTKTQFVQFLKTALSNELEMIATIVTDFEEAKKISVAKKSNKTESIAEKEAVNVFSGATFPGQPTVALPQEESSDDEDISQSAEYTDKKTGHIYVQGDELPEEMSQTQYYWEITIEKITDSWLYTRNNLRRKYNLNKQRIEKEIEHLKIKAEQRKQRLAEEKALAMEKMETEIKDQPSEAEDIEEIPLKEKIQAAKKQLAQVIDLREKENLKKIKKNKPVEIPEEIEQPKTSKQSSNITPAANSALKLSNETLKKCLIVCKNSIKKIKIRKINFKKIKVAPQFSKIINLYHSMTHKQRVNVFISLVIIFIIPIFIANWLNRPKPATIQNLPKIELTETEKLANEKNMRLKNEVRKIITGSDIISVFNFADDVISLTNKSLLVSRSNGQITEYKIPENAGTAIKGTYMKDLSMILIYTSQNKLLSFTPTNAKFSENNIDLAGISSDSFMGTYLTYLYILDPKANTIVRYPRAEGGFGSKTNWLKDSTTLSGTSDMTIDDSIYAIQNNQIIKFFKGSKQPLNFEASNTPVHVDKIFTTVDSQYVYVLDKQNSRIVKYDKSGMISAQYFNEALKDGSSITADEKNNSIFITTKSGLISLSM